MQSSKEQQRDKKQQEIRKPSLAINAKKQRKTTKWERLAISSRKLEIPRDFTQKDRNGMDLTEAEDIKKRWQEYTEPYKKELHDQDNHDSMITHLEAHILNL